jgi:hypothetical protein
MKTGLTIKTSKEGFIKEIRNPFSNKIIECVKVGKETYHRNNVYKTYNSSNHNDLLHKSNKKSIREHDKC